MRFIPNIPKIPLVLGAVSCAVLGVVPHHAAGAEEDPPVDVTGDAEEWCAQLASEGYDTTGCVDTYVAAYEGALDLGPDGEPYFDASAGELDLPCTDSVEYQAFLEDPFVLPDPCEAAPEEPVPCGPVLGGPVLGGPSLVDPVPDPCPVPVPPPAPPPPPKRLTWKPSFTTKLFIAPFGVNKCGTPLFVKLAGPRQIALYAAFCLATANSYKENPPNGNNAKVGNPLDARIWAKADFEIVCEENKPLPIAATVANGGTNGGFEVGNRRGVVGAPRIRNNIVANGTFGYVTSGRPNPLLEPTFAVAGGPRLRPDIWNKVTGTATCKTQGGVVSASIASNINGTNFPSHRLWWNGVLKANVAQGPMSVLWNLPAVPAA